MLPVYLLLAIAISVWFVYDKMRYANYPPGPIRIPVFGCLFSIARLSSYPFVAFQKLAKVYGDIFYVRMGSSHAVVINSFESVKEILGHEYTTERAQNMLPILLERTNYKNLGIAFGNGKESQTLRSFTIRTLRKLGFGKQASMNVIINEELNKFTVHLKELSSQNRDGIEGADALFSLTITNVLWRLLTGVKYKLNDSNMLRLLKLNHELFQTTNFAMDLSIAFPQLFHIFPHWMGKTAQLTILNKLKQFVQETIEHHRNLGDYKVSSNCYVDEFLRKIEESKDNPHTEFTDEQLVICLLDIFQSGSDTTSNSLSFSMLYMMLHPEIQGKIHAEMDANISKNEDIVLETRERLPFTCATLLECMRHSTVSPIPAARQASKDFYFKGYFIKKGMSMLSNIHAVHFSDAIWGDPYNFRPERFLDNEGQVDSKLPDYLLSFGHGSRKCVAANLAEDTLFLYFTTILRDFTILNADGEGKLSVQPNLGITLSPKPYKARYVPRT